MAQAFCRLGCAVTVVQRSGQILSKEDQDMADELMGVMSSEGVSFYLNSSVAEVKDLGDSSEIYIKTNDGKTFVLEAEALLVAMGRTPNVEGLGLENAGVDYDNRGNVKIGLERSVPGDAARRHRTPQGR